MYRSLLLSFSFFLLLLIANAAPPNIVFIMADDMGYGDVRALNPDSAIPTPHLDRLAKEGMTFTDGHSSSGVCTPTRYSVVTGRYSWRGRLKRGVLNGYGTPLIEPDRETVASFLSQQGYDTGIVGKWHLGLQFSPDNKNIDFTQPLKSTPVDYGFGYSYVIPASLDFPPYVYIDGHKVTDPKTVEQPAVKFPGFLRKGPRAEDFIMAEALHHLTEKAADFIRSRKTATTPFFLYFPLTSPHKPVLAHPDFVGKSGLGPYGDFIMQTDWTVGQVLKAIDEAGVAENTLVIYTSDNGSFMYREEDAWELAHVEDETIQAYRPENHTANGPFRGTKADIWEAGHRVPFFARWPARIAAGSTCDKTICSVDLFATAAELAGAQDAIPEDAAEDSISLVPLFDGNDNDRPPVIHHSASGTFAIRDGDWKLVAGSGSGGREKPRGKAFEKPYHLYNLAQDIGETKNLIAANPDIAERLEKRLEELREGRSRVVSSNKPEDKPGYDKTKDVGTLPPAGADVPFDGTMDSVQANWQMWPKADMEVTWTLMPDPTGGEQSVLMTDGGTKWGTHDLVTKKKYTDFEGHVEFIMMGARGDDKADGYTNSGVYLQNRYEIQIESPKGKNIADPYNWKIGPHGIAAFCMERVPDTNAWRPNGQWHSFHFTFTAATWDGDKMKEPARATVWWNGVKVHDNVPIKKANGGEKVGPSAEGLKLQEHGQDVRYRNIWIKDTSAK